MKICHLITRMIQGGAQENTLLTLQGLKRDTSWDVHLAYGLETGLEGSLVEDARALGAVLHPLRHLKREIHPWNDLRAYEELIEYFSLQHFDLVHTHSSKAGVLGRLAARRAGIPHIVHTVHGLAFDEFQPFWKNQIYKLAEKIAGKDTDRMIVVCQTMADQVMAAGVIGSSAIRVIHSGFSLENFLKIKPRVSGARFIVGIVARMFPEKGHEDLMRLAPRLLETWNDLDFRIVGDGPLRSQWEEWLQSHPQWRERFLFAGRVSIDQIPGQFEFMNMLLHLSWREGLARVIPQAFAAGRPVCVYNVGGAAEIVQSGVTGWTVSPGDFEGICECIRQIRGDSNRLASVIENARNTARSLFDLKVMQKQILETYLEMVNNQDL